MFDAMSYGLPFIATRLGFFVEFAVAGLGVAVGRNPKEFSDAMIYLDKNYDRYVAKISEFKLKLNWKQVAKEHAVLYHQVVAARKKYKQLQYSCLRYGISRKHRPPVI